MISDSFRILNKKLSCFLFREQVTNNLFPYRNYSRTKYLLQRKGISELFVSHSVKHTCSSLKVIY